jgi:hypothetical protein
MLSSVAVETRFIGALTRAEATRRHRAGLGKAGDAFYVPPGHATEAEAGSEFVQFSPSEELHATEAAMMANVQKMQSG